LISIHEIQIQDSGSSNEEPDKLPPTKTEMECKLVQIKPEIWINLPLEA
jgi:hypothetical protein